MNFICKRNLEYLKAFRKRQGSCQLPWLMINAGFDWDFWKVKSVVIFPALAVLDEGKGSDMTVPNLFSLTPKLCKTSNILFCVESTFLSPGLFSCIPARSGSALSWGKLLWGIRACWGSSTVLGSPFWVIDQTFFLSWLRIFDTWKHLDMTFLELD